MAQAPLIHEAERVADGPGRVARPKRVSSGRRVALKAGEGGFPARRGRVGIARRRGDTRAVTPQRFVSRRTVPGAPRTDGCRATAGCCTGGCSAVAGVKGRGSAPVHAFLCECLLRPPAEALAGHRDGGPVPSSVSFCFPMRSEPPSCRPGHPVSRRHGRPASLCNQHRIPTPQCHQHRTSTPKCTQDRIPPPPRCYLHGKCRVREERAVSGC